MESAERHAGGPRRAVVRLVVATPDRRRVLARPNGLAGWVLPTIPALVPLDEWTPDASTRAAAALGAPVSPVRRLTGDAWVVAVQGRISAAGTTWITVDDAARLGVDETVVRRWALQEGGSGDPTPHDADRG